MLVRLDVEVFAADGTEACAIGTAEDLLRQREGDRVACPPVDVELVVDEVRRPQLVTSFGIRRLVLPGVDVEIDDGVRETAVARPVQARVEMELEDRAGARARDDELGRNGVRDGQIALTAIFESTQLELDLVAKLLARAEPGATQVERLHRSSVAPDGSR